MAIKDKSYTLFFEEIEQGDKVTIGEWGVCKVDKGETTLSGDGFASLLDSFKQISGVNYIFVKKLNRGGKFIISQLYEEGYRYVEQSEYKKEARTFTATIGGNKQFYEIFITIGYAKKAKKPSSVRIRDIDKMLPLTMEEIEEAFGSPFKDEFSGVSEYNSIVMAKGVRALFERNMTSLTLSGNAMKDYMERIGGFEKFKENFPTLDEYDDNFARHSYNGGWCYLNENLRKEDEDNIKVGKGYVLDINSSYPAVMTSKIRRDGNRMIKSVFPVGKPRYGEGKYTPDRYRPCYIQHIFVRCSVKENAFPCISKGNVFNFMGRYLQDTRYEPEDGIELWLTAPDMELLFDFYDIDTIEYIDYLAFKGNSYLFDDFVKEHYRRKKTAKTAGDRLIAKLLTDSLYGKFGQKPLYDYAEPYLDNGLLCYQTKQLEEPSRSKMTYVPIASYIAAYARSVIVRAAANNYESFIYCDSDSIHITGSKIKDIVISQELGDFKIEKKFKSGVYVRSKTYLLEKDDGDYDLTTAGLNMDTRKSFTKDERRYIAEALIDNKAVIIETTAPQNVKGGVKDIKSQFRISI